MPIVRCEAIKDSRGNHREIGKELAAITHLHFAAFLGHSSIGISYGSCSAAVAVRNNGAGFNDPHSVSREDRERLAAASNYIGLANSVGFAAVMGNSRLYTGLDPDYNRNRTGTVSPPDTYLRNSISKREQHAEQTAILEAVNRGLQFWTYDDCCHVYVDLIPCASCMKWLQQRPERWCVYYHYEGETQAEDMNAFKREFQGRYKQSLT